MSMNINDNIPTVAVICGPTATGKTRLSVELARSFDGEIVSADSMQVYRRMDIGTAKATPDERCGVPHHMIDVAEPSEQYSVARYVQEASACTDDILARGKLPLIVGGTNLYIDSLLSGRDFASAAGEDPELRAELERRYDELGGEEMLRQLRVFDPERAEKLPPTDRRRIIRAFEVYRLTGKSLSEHDRETRLAPPRYRAAVIALDYLDREHLYARINDRVDEMVRLGLFEEVRALQSEGLNPDCTAMQAIGYKEPLSALRGEITKDEAIELIKRDSRRYAKRQLTWLRRKEGLLWIRHGQTPDFLEARRLSTEYLRSFGL